MIEDGSSDQLSWGPLVPAGLDRIRPVSTQTMLAMASLIFSRGSVCSSGYGLLLVAAQRCDAGGALITLGAAGGYGTTEWLRG
jgi:hypothetical protein